MLHLDAYIKDHEQWLMERILFYATAQGYTKYSSTLVEAWRASIQGLSEAVAKEIVIRGDTLPEFSPDERFRDDPASEFGVYEANVHRARGISLPMFLGLFKYYKYAYADLVNEMDVPEERKRFFQLFLERTFDRIEIAFCAEWAELGGEQAIHELQVANRAMTNEKNKYLTLFESLQLPAILVDQGGLVENLNAAAARLLGFRDVQGALYYSREREVPALSRLLPWMAVPLNNLLLDGESSLITEIDAAYPEGVRHFVAILSRMQDCSKKFTGAVIVLEDVTEKKDMERLKEDVARINSHDLKSPLSGMLGMISLLLDSERIKGEEREWLCIARKSGHDMLEIINSSLDVFKMEVGTYRFKPVAVSVCGVLHNLKDLSDALSRGHEVAVHMTVNGREVGALGTCPLVAAEKMLLHTALSNLLTNAIEASPRGETVRVEVRTDSECRIDIRNKGEVPEVIRERFFEKYATSGKRGGTGLGTYSSRLMIETMRGRVSMSSKDGETLVSIVLPLAGEDTDNEGLELGTETG